ncbi:hypothetical protein [Flavobacterium phycosphaerae]|uniref:hypothetical protein n=1 Tax=Flavobacterium phycosphaerae TaxID=2697515 RepID=UPI001389FC0D|nr:hypothetical protein [Flavobacterium phycosphaerae]
MKKKLLIIGLLFFSLTNSNAQLLGKLKKAASDVNSASNTVKTGEEVLKNTKKKAGGGASSGLKLDWNTFKQTPAVTFSSLLYGTNIGIGGLTHLESYTATFIPNKTINGTTVDPIYDQENYLKIKVYKDGQYLTYFEYSGNQVFDDGKKTKYNNPTSRYKRDGEWVGDTDIDAKKNGTGMYRLDFYAGDKMFYSFDFEIYKLTNNDSYAETSEMYLTRGPWNNYAYLNHAESGNLIFGFYLNHEEFMPNPSNARKTIKSVKWSLKMYKDNKPFAQHYGNTPNDAQVERAEWREFSCAMKSTDKANGNEIKFGSLTDGAYKIEVTLDSEKKPRIYNFTVKDKKIVLIPEQDRTKNTDPTRLIEGWNDYVWLKLEK